MTRVPRAIPGRDIRALPLKPAEAFLLSRIDANTGERDLALLTGLSEQEVEASLNRLFDLGAIDFVRGERGAGSGVPPKPPPVPITAPPRSSPTPMRRTTSTSIPAAPASHRWLYDPAELDEDVELDLERKRRILEMFYRLDALNHYELLGVERTAERKQIKSAYYELAPELHTDKYFGKRLGSYKAKIETIFSRITMAHDVLTHRDRRAEYDRQLEAQEKDRPSPEPPPPESLGPTSVRGDSDAGPDAERVRREALAKKLSGGYRRPPSGAR
jgi:hypothetical protein